jgi:hypothetical protein
MATVTLEGTPNQIIAAMQRMVHRHTILNNATNLSRHGMRVANRERRARLLEQRKLIRRAFDLIRWDPAEKAMVNTLAGALSGRLPLTSSVLESAEQIIAGRSTVTKG